MSNEPKAGMGIDPELLAAYIDQRLSPEQRAAVEAQLAADPDSHAVLVETMKAIDQISDTRVPVVPTVPEVPKGRVPRVQWAIAGGMLATAAALVLVLRLQSDVVDRLRGRQSPMDSIISSVGASRSVQGRLAGFDYAPFETRRRSGNTVDSADWNLQAAVLELEQSGNAARAHALGVGYLLLGHHDDAIRELQAALQRDRANQRLLVDYAAALYERGLAQGRDEDFAGARTAIDDALRASPTSLEALFNRALILEALRDQAATDAWRFYLANDGSSSWAAEARQRLARAEGAPR